MRPVLKVKNVYLCPKCGFWHLIGLPYCPTPAREGGGVMDSQDESHLFGLLESEHRKWLAQRTQLAALWEDAMETRVPKTHAWMLAGIAFLAGMLAMGLLGVH